MYRNNSNQLEFEDFILPFGGKLRSDNRWVKLSKQVPWKEVEESYRQHFSKSGMGSPAKTSRIALGSLIIKERLGTSDEETVEQIRENPYLQYFLGYDGYRDELPFDPSMLVHFRKRISLESLQKLNEKLVSREVEPVEQEDDEEHPPGGTGIDVETGSNQEPSRKGKLIIDATCAPADITYPTDLKLLNAAREKSEEIIDVLHEPLQGKKKKLRTYREKARKCYLRAAMNKRLTRVKRRKAIGQQLRYVRRDLKHIEELSRQVSLTRLSHRQYKNLLVVQEVYRQQDEMYQGQSKRIDDRIVSISQPHVRPIVRGKVNASTEFGAKLSASVSDGYVFLDRLSWDGYNESGDLKNQVEGYRKRFGYYPESVHADKIYRTRGNRGYCKARGIRLSGPPLGRPRKVVDEGEKKQHRQDELDRIEIEGKFGQGKRRFSLSCVMTKLAKTSECAIAITFLVMNLEKLLRDLFCLLFLSPFYTFSIIKHQQAQTGYLIAR